MTKLNRYLVGAAAGLATVLVIWLCAWLLSGSNLPPRTTLLGVDISRMSVDAAKVKLEEELKATLDKDIQLRIDDQTFRLPAANSGLSLEIEKSLQAAPKRSWNPATLRDQLFRNKALDPVISAQEKLFDAAMKSIERKVTIAPRNADVVFDGLQPKLIKAVEGRSLSLENSLQTIKANWLRTNQISLESESRQPKITDDQAEALLSYAKSATAAPVYLTLNLAKPVEIVIDPRVISQALTFSAGRDGALQPKWLKPTFVKLVGKNWSTRLAEPVNASFTMVNGEPRVQPSRDGLDVSDEKLNSAMVEVLGKSPDARRISITPEPLPAKVTTEMAGGLGIKEVIGTFTTFFPYAEYRITNIHRAARWMDGVIIKPGEVFSYNKVVGERTEARGFVPGIMIDRGVFKKDWGGGVSQVATTTWNAAWFSGLELLQHKPHSFYISRYPAGRESTVAWPSVDVKFRNNSGKPIFVDTSFTNKSVTVTIYGTKFVDVESESGPRTKPVPFKVRESDSEECIFQEGVGGFSIEVWRILKRDGVEIKREKYRTRYRPEDRIICTNPKAKWMNPPLSVQQSLND